MFTSVLRIRVRHPIIYCWAKGQNFWSEATKTNEKVGHGKKCNRSSKKGDPQCRSQDSREFVQIQSLILTSV